jgi:AbrB family looped-hinge helix DNA binding protein
MRQTATVTSKSMVTIPSKMRKKYSLHQGSKVEFVVVDGGSLLVPLKTLRELRGAGKDNAKALIEGIRSSKGNIEKKLEDKHVRESGSRRRSNDPALC